MKKQILIILLLALSISPIFAVEIVSNALTINLNNNSIQIFNPYKPSDNTTFMLTKTFYDISNSSSNYSNYSSCFYIPEQNFTFTDLFIINNTYKVVDLDINSKLLDCISLSSQLNTSLLNCQISASQLSNATSQLTICQLDRRDRDNSLANCEKEKSDLSMKATGNQNNGIIWLIAGSGLTALGFVIYLKSKRGESVGSKIKSEFSPLGAT